MNDLPLFAQRDRVRAAKLYDRVLDYLRDGNWHRAAEIARALHTTDRVIRQCADASEGRIISGQSGYKLTRFASNDEIDHAERWLISQSTKMKERALEIRRARNGRAA